MGRINNSDFEDDIILWIVLIVEKNYIHYPASIDALLYQLKAILLENYTDLRELILDDEVLVDILNVYKELNTPEILKEPKLRDQIRSHINKYKLNNSHANFYMREFVLPRKIINENQCKKRLM